jgi:hypothetical protein
MLARVTRVSEEHSASIFTAVRSVVPCITLNALQKKVVNASILYYN